ncbi:amino acid adenylation domain-containing protein [Tumebacillus sp. BK434]|uniref:non-ribosomal peptide synthetase n=1 Tax=Tumebacillus sp. BK434 TaxID=2512169 RepID=UPI0010474558|nr:non-ribosomal peptide synthetase [Tumebacillus sp. BK434]TCP54467.1 amino acid adenylation domain-containing protein [Tumebacillus sp. BK434]
MKSLSDRLAALSPEQRALLEKKLQQKNIDSSKLAKAEPAIPRRTSEGPAPLSVDQERIWFFQQMEPNDPAYNMYSVVKITGDLDLSRLEQSVGKIVERHEALRTTFAQIDSEPRAVVAEARTVPLVVRDARGLAEAAVLEQLLTEVQVPFDLEQGPLLRAFCWQTGEQEHVFLLIVNHLVSDHQSLGLFFGELLRHYEGMELPAVPLRYTDFAEWQREQLQGDGEEKLVSYWKERLAGGEFVLNLPTDRPRPAVQTYRGAQVKVALPERVLAGVKALGGKHGVSPFMVTMAAYQALLHRYTGQQDVLVGTPVSLRKQQETQGVIGFFLNTMVIRTDVSPELSGLDLLLRTKEAATGAFSHGDMPFGLLLEEIKPKRDLSRSPIFQAMFTYVEGAGGVQELAGLTLEPMEFDGGTAKCDLSLTVMESAAGAEVLFEYASDLFDAATIERMAGHYLQLLAGLVQTPERKVGALPLLTDAEQKRLLVDWNQTQADLEPQRSLSIQAQFQAQVARTPDAVAVVFGGEELTFAELDSRANALAHHLVTTCGVGPSMRVAILAERSLAMITGLLGILKTGAAYVPLDPAYPAERVAYVLQDANVQALVTHEKNKASLSGLSDLPVVSFDTIPSLSGEVPALAATDKTVASVNDLAYMIYTSGSTGQPKGVMVEQGNVANFFGGMDERIQPQEGEVLLAATSYAFDISVLELLWTLTRGIKTVIVADPAELPAQAAKHGVTLLQGTPSLMKMALGNPAAIQALQGLRLLMLGGEALPGTLAKAIREKLSCRLFNMYGPTETTVWSSTHEVQTDDQAIQPIGKPILNTEFYILDPHLQPVPVGVPGELYIGGAGVTRGYFERPDLTAERFLPNPFTGQGRIYRTGDAARWLADGAVEYLGRLDQQVKVRGFRIELGEVEARLHAHPDIHAAAAAAMPDPQGDLRLIGYIVPQPGKTAPDSSALRAFLQTALPDYMVPAAFVTMESLPLTPNGKLDRKALPQPDLLATSDDTPPQNAVQEVLVQLFCELLGLERVSLSANFFEIGGHSLRATQLVASLQGIFSLDLTLHRVFDRATILDLEQELHSLSDPALLETQAQAYLQNGLRQMPNQIRALARPSRRRQT